MISHTLVALCLCMWLVVRHQSDPLASPSSKRAVLIAGVLTLVMYFFPIGMFGLILIFGVAGYVLVYRIIHTPEKHSRID